MKLSKPWACFLQGQSLYVYGLYFNNSIFMESLHLYLSSKASHRISWYPVSSLALGVSHHQPQIPWLRALAVLTRVYSAASSPRNEKAFLLPGLLCPLQNKEKFRTMSGEWIA